MKSEVKWVYALFKNKPRTYACWGHTKASSAPSLYAFFCPSLIFQICLNYFLPKIIHIPPRSVCHDSTTCTSPAPRHICLFLPSADISNLFELFFTQNYPHTPTLRVPCLDYRHVLGAPTYVPFLPSADISNLFELFFSKIIHIPPRSVCHASTTSMSSAPPHMCKYHDSCVDTVD